MRSKIALMTIMVTVLASADIALAQESRPDLPSVKTASDRPPSSGDTLPQLTSGSSQIFSFQDYPPAALSQKQEGGVAVMLDVDEAGRPTHCRVTESSGFESLDEGTCAVAMRKARFNPALRDGKPVAGTFKMPRVRWAIPVESNELSVGVTRMLANHEVEYSLNARGEVTGCKVISNTLAPTDPCAGPSLGTRLASPPTRNGQPVASKVRMTMSVAMTAD